jgi:hypothetical protein
MLAQASPGKNVCGTPSQWKKAGCDNVSIIPSDCGKHKIGSQSMPTWTTPKITRAERAGGMAGTIVLLPRK